MTLEEAQKELGEDIQADGGLYNLGHFLHWSPGDATVCLDDYFTIKELEAIVVWIKAHQKP